MIDIDIWQRLINVEVLTCSKSKYLSFFSSQRDFRHAGMDVTRTLTYQPEVVLAS